MAVSATRSRLVLAGLMALAVHVPTPIGAEPGARSQDWVRQFGTTGEDVALDVATDPAGRSTVLVCEDLSSVHCIITPNNHLVLRQFSRRGVPAWTVPVAPGTSLAAMRLADGPGGEVAVAGTTNDALLGRSSAGGRDGVVVVYGASGTQRWARQVGTSADDLAWNAAFGPDGSVAVVGGTFGELAGTGAGLTDAFVRSYDRAGAVRWTRQFGTAGHDTATDVAIGPDGTVFVSGLVEPVGEGTTPSVFVRALRPDGADLWARSIDAPMNGPFVSLDLDPSGNPFLLHEAPAADGDVTAAAAVLRRLTPGGADVWTRRLRPLPGATTILPLDLEVDAGGAYAGGWATVPAVGSPVDRYAGFVVWCNPSGTEDAAVRLGDDGTFASAVGLGLDAGHALVSGVVTGRIGGDPPLGGTDAFLTRLHVRRV